MAFTFQGLMWISAFLQTEFININSDFGLICTYIITALLSALVVVTIMRKCFKANLQAIIGIAILGSIPYIKFSIQLFIHWPGVSTGSVLRALVEVLMIYLAFGMAYLICSYIQSNRLLKSPVR